MKSKSSRAGQYAAVEAEAEAEAAVSAPQMDRGDGDGEGEGQGRGGASSTYRRAEGREEREVELGSMAPGRAAKSDPGGGGGEEGEGGLLPVAAVVAITAGGALEAQGVQALGLEEEGAGCSQQQQQQQQQQRGQRQRQGQGQRQSDGELLPWYYQSCNCYCTGNECSDCSCSGLVHWVAECFGCCSAEVVTCCEGSCPGISSPCGESEGGGDGDCDCDCDCDCDI